MKKLASRTGGEFFEAKDEGTIRAVYRRIAELETVDFAEAKSRLEERFLPFLILGILFNMNSIEQDVFVTIAAFYFDITTKANGMSVLSDLISFWKVRIKIVLPIKCRKSSYLTIYR